MILLGTMQHSVRSVFIDLIDASLKKFIQCFQDYFTRKVNGRSKKTNRKDTGSDV